MSTATRSTSPAALPGQRLPRLLLALAVAAAPATAICDSGTAAPAAEDLAEVVVIGSRERLRATPGAGAVLDGRDLERSRVFTVNEALRKVPGVFARDEEGLGLRPNIGIRGLNPTRSSKVLLLEDGLPLAFAPYGDNASYYHPPVERFERIEVLKGSGQIAFGPQTVGGVINYLTPAAPTEFGGALLARGGNRGFRDLQLRVGDALGDGGWAASLVHKDSDGARENMALNVDDLALRFDQALGERRSLALRASLYREDSQVPYSGLTRAEYAANPLGNVFRNDRFALQRWALSATLGQQFDAGTLRSSVYYTYLDRDWWRQSSNSGQRPADASDPACRGLQNLETGCGNEGRLRQYYTAGIETRGTRPFALGALQGELSGGLRHHVEKQNRRQVNGDTAAARVAGTSLNAGVREDNTRDVAATAAFIQAEFVAGDWRLTPGLRYETVDYERRNRLAGGAQGRSRFDEVIPGVGLTWEWRPGATLFAGVHRGFAPPRVEDVIGPAGGSVELEAERSWNRELGLRLRPRAGTTIELTAFDLDFSNQVVPSSVAGGAGATLTSAGRSSHRGLEFAATVEQPDLLAGSIDGYLRAALTWLADAQYLGERFSAIPGFNAVPVRGNRLPYAPEQLATVAFGLEAPQGFAAEIEAVYTSAAFTDDLNTVAVSVDGQRGRIGGYAIVNATVSQRFAETLTVFASAKNLADRRYVADMSRGLIPGSPRQLQLGFDYRF
jgi:Fe(3+) dicitrate transport protein